MHCKGAINLHLIMLFRQSVDVSHERFCNPMELSPFFSRGEKGYKIPGLRPWDYFLRGFRNSVGRVKNLGG